MRTPRSWARRIAAPTIVDVSGPSSKSYCASSSVRSASSTKAAIFDATSTAVWPPSFRVRIVTGGFIDRLAAAEIGATYNFYRDGGRATLLRRRLERYLDERAAAGVLIVAEAPGYRGTRVSGIPLISERQLTGAGPAEATATVVHRVLAGLGCEDEVLLWNAVPTHPGAACSNRPPTRVEIEAGLAFARELAAGRRVVAVGRVAHGAFGGTYVRHPSHGGAAAFHRGLERLLS